MFLLQLLVDHPDGITAYELEKTYFISRTTVMRIMEKLSEVGYVSSREETEGRTQKFFLITEEGEAYLEKIKEKLASQFYTIAEMAPPDHYANPFIRKGPRHRLIRDIDKLKDKKQAIDFFSGMRYRVTSFKDRVNNRVERLQKTEDELSAIIDEINKMNELDIEKIKEMVKKTHLEPKHSRDL